MRPMVFMRIPDALMSGGRRKDVVFRAFESSFKQVDALPA